MKVKQHKFWTTKELQFLKDNLDLKDKDLAVKLNTTEGRVKNARKRYKIIKPKDKWGFKKGDTAWNKGMEQSEFISADKIESVKKNLFKKGNKPKNYKRDVGQVYERKSDGKICLFIKLKDNRQYSYPRYVWEQKTGEKLTEQDIITFKDNNQLNCEFVNLKKISRGDNVMRNRDDVKTGLGLRRVWSIVKAFEAYGAKSKYKFQSKRKKVK